MCMTYKGVDYHYAFEFKIPVENSADNRILNVVISNYRDGSQDFSGLCLENELRVVSEEKMLFAAFFDIVDSIVKITTEGEKAFLETHGQIPTPLMSVVDQTFINKFNIYKQAKKSLDYYERLRIAFERPKTIKEKIFNRLPGHDIMDCHNLVPFNYLVQVNEAPIKDINFFRL
jgi:hypothetical protein